MRRVSLAGGNCIFVVFSSVDFVAKREGKVGLTERTDREWGKRA